MTKKEVKVTVVPFEEYTEYDFVDLSTFFFKDAMGNRHYVHTSKRAEAQRVADEYSGVPGKYKVIATREQKTKSKLESGELSCTGVSTRKCFSPRLKGLK